MTQDVITAEGVKYYLDDFMKAKMTRNGLNKGNIRGRIANGWTFEEAIDAPQGMRRDDYLDNIAMAKLEQSKRAELRQQEELRLRKKKPHLFNIPQKHKRGRWCQHLMDNNIFPKAKIN